MSSTQTTPATRSPSTSPFGTIVAYTIILSIIVLISCTSCAPTDIFGSRLPPKPPAGWTKLTGAHVAIWLPPTYQGVSRRAEIQQLIADMRAAGPGYAAQADNLTRNLAHIDLIAYDSAQRGTGCAPELHIRVSDPSLQTVELDERGVQAVADTLHRTDGFEIQEVGMVQFEQFGAGRIVMTSAGSCHKTLVYMVPWGRNYWFVMYTATADEFAQQLPIFEQSIRTFVVEVDPNT